MVVDKCNGNTKPSRSNFLTEKIADFGFWVMGCDDEGDSF
jgi:hypothetical protein